MQSESLKFALFDSSSFSFVSITIGQYEVLAFFLFRVVVVVVGGASAADGKQCLLSTPHMVVGDVCIFGCIMQIDN